MTETGSRSPTQPPIGEASEPAWPRWALLVGYCLIAGGVALRLREFVHNRSMRLDELLLWASLGEPSLSRFLEPLTYGQVAASGFVFVVSVMRCLFGDSEFVLRAPALLAGLAALPLTFRLVRRVLQPLGGLFVLGLLAVSPHAVFYSVDLKPYTFDLCAAVIVLDYALQILRGERTFSGWRFVTVGVASVFLSLPAVIVLGSTAMILMLRALVHRSRAAIQAIAVSSAIWSATFVIQHQTLLASKHDDPAISNVWDQADAFPPEPRSAVSTAKWLLPALTRSLADPVGLPAKYGQPNVITWIGVGIFAFGAALMFRRRRHDIILFAVPVAFTLVAAVARLYPYFGRVLLFLVPALSVPIGAGFDWITRAFRSGGRRLAWTAALLGCLGLTSISAFDTLTRRFENFPPENGREVMFQLRERAQPGDAFLLTNWSALWWRYYREGVGLPNQVVPIAWLGTTWPPRYVSNLRERTAPFPRVWLLLVQSDAHRESLALAEANLVAARIRVVDTIVERGALAVLLDFAGS